VCALINEPERDLQLWAASDARYTFMNKGHYHSLGAAAGKKKKTALPSFIQKVCVCKFMQIRARPNRDWLRCARVLLIFYEFVY